MSRRVSCIVLFLLALVMAGVAYGQIRSATITGTVTDSTGAVVPGAQVTLTEQQTDISNPTKTTEAGLYTVPYLPAGNYTLSIKASGFAEYKMTGVAVATGQTVRLDAELKLATVGEAVEVSAQVVSIQTDSSTVQSSITAQAIDILPNAVSNPVFYAFFQAGVMPRVSAAETTTINSFGIGVHGRKEWNAVGINGGRAWTSDIQLDGLPVNGGGYNELSVSENTEGLGEVRIVANDYSAQYGHGQGVIQMSTKSGTNQFHGQANYNLRNEALMANTMANKSSWTATTPYGIQRPPFKVNEVGGAVGGPILKDKLFFFSSYHYMHFNRGVDNLRTVLTPLEAQGNFSQTLVRNEAGLPSAAVIYDPFNVVQVNSTLYQRVPIPNANLSNYPGSQYGQTWFSNAITAYPAPNRTPDDVYNTNNFYTRVIQTIRRHNSNNRADYRLGRNSIYFSGGIDKAMNITPRIYGKDPINTAPAVVSDDNPYGQLGDTLVVSPTLIVDLRYGFSRIDAAVLQGNTSGWDDKLNDQFGMPKNIRQYFNIPDSAPVLPVTDGGNGKNHSNQQLHSLTGSLTKTHGRWTHKFGGEARVQRHNYTDPVEISASYPSGSGGNYNFQYVNADGSSNALNSAIVQQGITNARYFLGVPGWSISPGRNVRNALTSKYAAVYTQNDWRATNRLTLNLGFRWDLQPGSTERYNRLSGIDLNAFNPFGYRGSIVFPLVNGYSRNLWDTQYTNIGPRFGFAYQATRDMVVRGGYGVSYLPSNTGYFESQLDYGEETFSTGTMDQPYGPNPNGVPAFREWQDCPVAVAVGANPAAPVVYGQSFTYFDRNFKNGRAQQFNLFVERRFRSTWFASIGYSGSTTAHLYNRAFPIQNNLNVPSTLTSSWAASYIASNLTLNPATQLITNPYQPASGTLYNFGGALGAATIARQSTYYPYPLLIGNSISISKASAHYNSLQVHVTHAFSRGYHMDLSYTFSKEIDNTNTMEDAMLGNPGGSPGSSMLDINNLKNNLRLGGDDAKHRMTGIFLYDFPMGAGKWLDAKNRVVNAVIGGWQTGSTLVWQSGFPIVISGDTDGALIARSLMTGAPLEVPKELQKWYDGNTVVTLPNGRVIQPTKNTFLKYYSGAFAGPVVTLPNGKYGAAQNWVGSTGITPSGFRTPGRFNIDVSLRRSVKLKEKITVEMSLQASNALNHTELSGGYSGALGTTTVTPNPSIGLLPGMGSSSTFGTIGNTTYPAREIDVILRVRF